MAEGGRRRERDRATTERNLLDAAWTLFERDGILAGLILNEVAAKAGANRASIYQHFERARTSIAQDVNDGTLPADTDVDLAHVMPLATYVGYALLREWVAEELDLELDELDQRARPIFEAMLRGLSADTVQDAGSSSSTAA